MHEPDWQHAAQAFIADHWPGPERLAHPSAYQLASVRWYEALGVTGWSTPHWPAGSDGASASRQSWPKQRLYQWQMFCHEARTPPINTLAMSLVAPLVMTHGSERQRKTVLPEIAAFDAHWCLGLLEPVTAASAEPTRLHVTPSGTYLQGAKRALADGLLMSTELSKDNLWPSRMLCIALDDTEQWRACLLSTDCAGIECRPVANARGRWFHVVLNKVVVAPDEILALSGDALLAALAQPETLSQSVLPEASSFGLAEQLRLLRAELTANTHEDTETLLTQLYEAEVALQGLRALESRALAAAIPPLATALPMPMLSLKAEELGQQIGALQLASFGYYALPDASALREHNEGPIHPRGDASGETAMVTSQALNALAASHYGWNPRDILARQWLGLGEIPQAAEEPSR
ncbi:MAG: acyl-CoA dehydrogenase family protein [Pseudomonadales bacterium]|nr:acyl-CoA dehydrogenase family protein [Pseudomonadales bacterium]